MKKLAIIGMLVFVLFMSMAIYQVYMLRQELQQFRSEVELATTTIGNIQRTVKQVTGSIEELKKYSNKFTETIEDLESVNRRLNSLMNALDFFSPNR